MKKCSKCCKQPAAKGQYYCKGCQQEYSRLHYEKNKDIYLERNDRRRKDIQRKVVLYLKEHPCVDCGEDDPVVLDFDHVRGKKVLSVSALVGLAYSWAAVWREIKKCVVRCSNCHRRKTYGRSAKWQAV